jgi:hypothetical protein
MQMQWIIYEVETEFLNIIYMIFSFSKVLDVLLY